MSTIGQRIKALRIKNRLSLQELAELVGKSKGNISGYENDKYEPSAQTIISIAKYFNVSIDWLLNGVDFKDNNKTLDSSPSNTLKSKLELEILEMFRLLDERDKEDVFESIKFKYDRTLKRGTSKSLYSTYTNLENKDIKSETNNDDSGIA